MPQVETAHFKSLSIFLQFIFSRFGQLKILSEDTNFKDTEVIFGFEFS